MLKGKNSIGFVVLSLLLIFSTEVNSQTESSKYPQGYFRNPLGIPMQLSANFGELRSTHWHMGFDIRTNQRENYPVFAAADGYVSRVGIRPLSFGKFMVISHPNGYSTLYAHLKEFYPELEKYVRERQAVKEFWAVELNFNRDQFKLKKGDEIAKSGNTGGSQGPHLHFEIQDTRTGRSINPQLFGFGINDITPPAFSLLAMYDRAAGTYLQTPRMIPVQKTVGRFLTKPGKVITGNRKVSFAIGANDRITGSSSPNGIFKATLYFDGKPLVLFVLDSMSYPESNYINGHIDRKYKNSGGPYLQHLSILPGFQGTVYEKIQGDGIIELYDTLVHNIKIEILDAKDNHSSLNFQLQYNESNGPVNKLLSPSKILSPAIVNVFEEKELEAYFPEINFYDSVPFIYFRQNSFLPGAVTAQHQLGDPVYPVHSSFYVRLKPIKSIPAEYRNKIIMMREWKKSKSFRIAEWQKDWLAASFDDFGNFVAFIDTVAPVINAPAKGKDTLDLSSLKRIVFTPVDNSSIKSFRAELNGKWLMFSNDKGKNYVYNFDKQCPYGIHELKVRVEDIAGNITEKTWRFKRHPYSPPRKKVTTTKKTVSKK